MKQPYRKHIIAALAVSSFLLGIAGAEPYAKGSAVESFTANDQYEQVFTLQPKTTKFLLVSHDMETGKKANAVLTTLGKDFLVSKKAVYLANIHGMPGVGRMFAIPKMKKYAHRIILADDEALIAKFPEEKNKVTLLTLSAGKVSAVRYWSPGTEALDPLLK